MSAPIDDSSPALRAPRRSFLVGAGALGAAAAVPGCADVEETTEAPPQTFQHGVASGDALADAVILWTRVTTETPNPVVRWQIATDTTFATVVGSGEVATDASRDFTVKLDVTGLTPATTYYYQFELGDDRSPIGRTRTLPASGDMARVRLGVVSCASYAHGWFHVYASLAARADLDGVIHLGDYIYEYGDRDYGDVRNYDPPHEIVTLDDYRRRYAHYRKDPDLAEAHRQHPFFTVWDDHEFANNAFPDGAENHDPATEGLFADRKAAAQQAYSEWMPIRAPDPAKIYRSFRVGDALELFLCDTRMWGRSAPVGADDPAVNDPGRTLLGSDQEKWLFDGLGASTARFKVVAQQVMMAPLPLSSLRNNDQWDGFPAARARFYDLCKTGMLSDVMVLTGDIHTTWASDLVPDGDVYDPATGAGSVAVELVVPGVSSPGLGPLLAGLGAELQAKNPHFKLVDITRRGYVILDVDAERAQGAYHHVDQVESEARPVEAMTGAFSLRSGERKLTVDGEAAPDRTGAPPLAPEA